jgi:hypothetical protein
MALPKKPRVPQLVDRHFEQTLDKLAIIELASCHEHG